jgi:hypothetical protein
MTNRTNQVCEIALPKLGRTYRAAVFRDAGGYFDDRFVVHLDSAGVTYTDPLTKVGDFLKRCSFEDFWAWAGGVAEPLPITPDSGGAWADRYWTSCAFDDIFR